MRHTLSVMLAAGLCIAAIQAADASPIAPGFTGTTLQTCDDCASGSVSLGFSADFFGLNYSSAFIGSNGYLTFGASQTSYTPTGLTASYTGNPIIAPFYADVDTNNGGTITYGTGTYAGHNAFGVNYNAVGYYGSTNPSQTDTFQVILVDRSDASAGAFDIYMNYGSMQWETGTASGGSSGFGGTSAAVGYANGSGNPGTYYQLPGSLVPGSFTDSGTSPLATTSNDGTPGQYLFSVRNGVVVSSVPEPSSLALFGAGFFSLGLLRRRRRAA